MVILAVETASTTYLKGNILQYLHSLKQTASLHLKNGGWEISLSFWGKLIFRCKLAVSFRCNIYKMNRSNCSDEDLHIFFRLWDEKTPLKINMEHNHGGLVQIIFLSKWVICRFQKCQSSRVICTFFPRQVHHRQFWGTWCTKSRLNIFVTRMLLPKKLFFIDGIDIHSLKLTVRPWK